MYAVRPLLSLLALAIVVAPGASAQTAVQPAVQPAPPAPAAPKPYIVGLTANTMSIAPTVAAGQMVGARSYGMQFDAGVTFARYLFAGADFGLQFLKDRAGFTQATTAGDMSSTATLVYVSAMAGAKTASVRIIPGLAATSLGVYGGASKTSGQRSIDKCSNCTTEDITVAGGPFVQPTLVFGEGAMRWRVSDRVYMGDKGIRSVISLGIELGGR
ncbi:MAG: hypothetical protein JWN79_921 [Gemmatimonadetes bacterium]|nr:hypothetical protein [Gemmatimonadota bacterium]